MLWVLHTVKEERAEGGGRGVGNESEKGPGGFLYPNLTATTTTTSERARLEAVNT